MNCLKRVIDGKGKQSQVPFPSIPPHFLGSQSQALWVPCAYEAVEFVLSSFSTVLIRTKTLHKANCVILAFSTRVKCSSIGV